MKSFLRSFGFTVLVIGAVLMWLSKDDFSYAFETPVDINVDYPEKIEDIKAVKTEFDVVLDSFATLETTTTNKSGAVTDRSYTYYFIVPIYLESDEEAYWVGVEVSEKNFKAYDHIADLTWEYLLGETDTLGTETVAFEGGLVKMDEEAQGYFYEWFEESEWFTSEEAMKKYALPLMLNAGKLSTVKNLCIASIAAVVVGILMIIIGFIPSKKKEIPAPAGSTIDINGIVYPTSTFASVNENIVKGATVQAIKQVREITGLGLAEAKAVVDNWNQYWV